MVVKIDKVPFEDALDMTGFGKFNVLSFLLCSSIIIGMTTEIFSVSYLVPASACELSTSSAQQGIIAAVPLVGIIITSHVWGYLADTKGRRKILILSMTLAFVSGSLAAFSPHWIVLSMLKLCSSAAVSGALALSLTLLSEYTPIKRRNIFILLTTSILLASSGIMAVIAIPTLPLKFSYYVPVLNIHFNSWRLLCLIFSMPTAFAAVGVACSYESPKYLLSVGQDQEALRVLQGIFSINSGKDRDFYRANSVVLEEAGSSTVNNGFWASVKAQTLPLIRPPLLNDTLLLSCLFVICYICINPFLVWLPFIFNAFMVSVENGATDMTLCEMIRLSRNSTSVEENEACLLNQTAMMMVFGMSTLIGILNLVTSSVVNCIGRKSLFICVQLICGTAALFINASTIWSLSAIFFVVYVTSAINFGPLTSFTVDVFPTYVKAIAICVTLMVGRGSAVFGINLLKSLLDSNCEVAFYIFGGVAMVGGVVGFLLPSDATLKERKQLLKIQYADDTKHNERLDDASR